MKYFIPVIGFGLQIKDTFLTYKNSLLEKEYGEYKGIILIGYDVCVQIPCLVGLIFLIFIK